METNNQGSTLLEVIIYVTVFGIIIIGISNAVLSVYKTRVFVYEQIQSGAESRRGLSLLVGDIREASYGDNGAYPVENISDYSFTFYSDIDNDNKVERIRYFVEDGVLKRGVTKSSGIPPVYDSNNESVSNISLYVQNEDQNIPLFTFYDNSGNQIDSNLDLIDIRYVVIHMATDLNPNRQPEQYIFKTTATLRNLTNGYAE